MQDEEKWSLHMATFSASVVLGYFVIVRNDKVFKKTLRYYSLADDCVDGGESHHGGKVDASGLESALKTFGIYPDKKEISGARSVRLQPPCHDPHE